MQYCELKKLILFFALLILFHFKSSGQAITLSVKVTDNESQPLNSATVTIISQIKKEISGATDKLGTIKFTGLYEGVYNFNVRSLTFDTTYVNNVRLFKDTTIVVVLKPQSSVLREVKITGTKPMYERKIDRLVFNVENSLMSKGVPVWDLFNKAPGVETSNDGTISINMKSASVYINDRIVKLSGEDLSSYLKNISSDNISKIEFIANPPAKYDAQGGAVINIITKKSASDGFNANLSSGYARGTYNRINESGNFNYRSGNFNVFGNYGYRDGKVGRDEKEYIIFQAPSSYSLWDNDKHGYKNSPSHTYEAGVDYDLDKNNVVGLIIDGYNTASTRTNLVNTTIYNNHRTTADSTLTTNNLTKGGVQQYTFNMNYKGKLDTAGRTLDADIDYTPYHNSNNQSYNTITGFPDGESTITTPPISDNSRQKINIFTGKMDYSNPFKNKWRLDLGVKYSSIQNNNDFENYNITNNVMLLNPAGSNIFDYSERTSAVYGNLAGSVGKVSFQFGLREEYTRTSGVSLSTDSIHKNNYFKLFPTLYLQYPTDKDNELDFYYGERISRPDYWRLSPFKYYTSPNTYIEGNPFLQPSFTNSFDLSDTYKQNYGIGFFYDRTNNVFSNITQQDNTSKVFFDTQANLGKSIQSGLYAFATVDVNKWWSMDSYIRGAYKIEQSAYLEGAYDYHKVTGYANLTNDFVISKAGGLRAQLSSWYSTSGIQGIFKLDKRYDLSSAISKSVFEGRGNLRLSFADILNSNKYKIDVNYLDQQNGFVETNDTRTVNLTFSMKIGNSNSKRTRTDTGSAQEEKNRALH